VAKSTAFPPVDVPGAPSGSADTEGAAVELLLRSGRRSPQLPSLVNLRGKILITEGQQSSECHQHQRDHQCLRKERAVAAGDAVADARP
jgi:hypothetical protein